LLAYCHAMLHFLAAPCSKEAGHLWQEQEEEEEEEEEERVSNYLVIYWPCLLGLFGKMIF